MQQPFLIGEKIYLRVILESDLNENYQQWFNDAEVCVFNSHHRFPNYRENMKGYFDTVIKSRDNLVLAIIDKQNERHIGNISLQGISHLDGSAELALIIGDKNYWGKAIGEEACHLIIDHGFNALNLHRIYCGTSIENKGMIRLAQKVGFQQEGIVREALFKNGGYKDILNFGLLKNEYKK